MFRRKIYKLLSERFRETRKFIQVLYGPRQVGKTTLAQQIIEKLGYKSMYASADDPTLKDTFWIEQQWDIARVYNAPDDKEILLVLDEIQKIPNWSEITKKLWDEDTKNKRNIKILLLGSSPLLIQSGLSESLAGRFETLYAPHWSFDEMKEAFGFDLDQFVFYGGYPGSASLIADLTRWKNYIANSLIETTISRDILLTTRVDKPVLFRRLFQLACDFSGQILSYQKMIGQLQDIGNTTTLAHYLELLSGVGMVAGVFKYSGSKIQQRSSSPKLQVYNTALISALSRYGFKEARENLEIWGRFVESAIGAYLLNSIKNNNINIYYWRDQNYEVDFVLERGDELIAIEVKSGGRSASLPGMKLFDRTFQPKRKLLVGGDGIPVGDFLSMSIEKWFE